MRHCLPIARSWLCGTIALILFGAASAMAGPRGTLAWTARGDYGGTMGSELNAGSVNLPIYTSLSETIILEQNTIFHGSATVGIYGVESGFYFPLGYNPSDFTGTIFDSGFTITDAASGKTGAFAFGVSFNVAGDGRGVVPVFVGSTTKSQTIGGNNYTVTESFDPSGTAAAEPGNVFDGRIVAHVNTVSTTPEPATLTLAGLALAGAAVARWRRNRVV